MNDTMIALVRREFWESPVAFRIAPMAIGGVMILLMLLAMLMTAEYDSQQVMIKDAIRLFAQQDPTHKVQALNAGLFGVSVLFNIAMFFIIIFYLLGALFDDRKDRSILFWKSLPISDTQTVLSKLLTATLAVPLVFLLAIMATHLVLMTIASVYTLVAGENIWQNVWGPSNLLSVWGTLALGYVVYALWMLPIYGWLLFVSAFAPRLPLLIAVAVPLVIGFAQNYLTFFRNFRLPDNNIMTLIGERLTAGIIPLSLVIEDGMMGIGSTSAIDAVDGGRIDPGLSIAALLERLLTPSLWIGVVIGVLFVIGAIWFRRRATDG